MDGRCVKRLRRQQDGWMEDVSSVYDVSKMDGWKMCQASTRSSGRGTIPTPVGLSSTTRGVQIGPRQIPDGGSGCQGRATILSCAGRTPRHFAAQKPVRPTSSAPARPIGKHSLRLAFWRQNLALTARFSLESGLSLNFPKIQAAVGRGRSPPYPP
jgi:hypothetical protein